MTLLEGKNLTQNFNFRGYIPTFRGENSQKCETFKAKITAHTTSEQLLSNFEKVQKMGF